MYALFEYSLYNGKYTQAGSELFALWCMAQSVPGRAERPFSIAVEREKGQITVLHTFLRGEEFLDANYRYAERTVKFLLWSVGGFRVYLNGDDAVIDWIKAAYTHKGVRAFDVQFMRMCTSVPLKCCL